MKPFREPYCRPAAAGGFALLIVLMLVAVASVLGVAYMVASSVQAAGSKNLADLARAEYLAESGVHNGTFVFRRDVTSCFGTSHGPYAIDESADTYHFTIAAKPYAAITAIITGQGQVGNVGATRSAEVMAFSRYAGLIRSYDPRAYWRMGDIGTSVMLDSDVGYDGMYFNGVQLGQSGALLGETDTAARFDGVDDYARVSGFDIYSGAMSIVVWFKTETFTNNRPWLVSKAVGDGGGDTWWGIFMDGNEGDADVKFRVKTDQKGTEEVKTNDKLKAEMGDWVFVVGTYDGTMLRLYVNGTLRAQREQSGTIARNSNLPVWIGGNQKGATEKPWHGRIDEVAIFSSALSAAQVSQLYEARLAEIKVVSWTD